MLRSTVKGLSIAIAAAALSACTPALDSSSKARVDAAIDATEAAATRAAAAADKAEKAARSAAESADRASDSAQKADAIMMRAMRK